MGGMLGGRNADAICHVLSSCQSLLLSCSLSLSLSRCQLLSACLPCTTLHCSTALPYAALHYCTTRHYSIAVTLQHSRCAPSRLGP